MDRAWKKAALTSSMVIVGLALACGKPSSTTPQSAGPTPDIEGTVQARVQATADAARPASGQAAPAAAAAVTAQPAAVPPTTVSPTDVPPTPVPPTPTPELTRTSIWVANTDGEGVIVRNSPNLTDRSQQGYAEGAPLTQLGDPLVIDGSKWLRISVSDGVIGYIPAQYARNTPPPTPVPPTPVPTALPGVGAQMQNGEWQIKLDQVGRNSSGLGSWENPTRPQGTFLIVDLVLTNMGKRTMSLNDWDFTVLYRDIKYSLSSEGSYALLGYKTGYEPLSLGATVQPGLSKKVALIFDVPPTAKGLVLEAAGMRFSIPEGKKSA